MNALTREQIEQYQDFARKLRAGNMFDEPVSWPEISSQVHTAADTIDALCLALSALPVEGMAGMEPRQVAKDLENAANLCEGCGAVDAASLIRALTFSEAMAAGGRITAIDGQPIDALTREQIENMERPGAANSVMRAEPQAESVKTVPMAEHHMSVAEEATEKATPAQSGSSPDRSSTERQWDLQRQVDLVRERPKDWQHWMKYKTESAAQAGVTCDAAIVSPASADTAPGILKTSDAGMPRYPTVIEFEMGVPVLNCTELVSKSEYDLLRTRLAAVERGHDRYEYVRTLNANQFAELWTRCVVMDLRFDDEVDAAIAAKESPEGDVHG